MLRATNIVGAFALLGALSVWAGPASTNGISPGFTVHLAKLKPAVPRGFSTVVQSPFVVLGDEPPETVRQRADTTVKSAVDHLKLDFFTRDPDEIIDIWLFKDGASYTNHAKELFDEIPASHFGYYSASRHALLMNISTGGGTLVHEIVHPYIHANFPECPPWFNEGLASLYEASTVRSGHIVGLINWRFKGLEQAIKEHQTIPFSKLAALDDSEFYGEGSALHYSQARYLCYYLQENGLLVKFYREFCANVKADPDGLKSLQHVLGETDLHAFQVKWEKFILDLRPH
jgi:hypothetical protein